jgi:hypothetical protein
MRTWVWSQGLSTLEGVLGGGFHHPQCVGADEQRACVVKYFGSFVWCLAILVCRFGCHAVKCKIHGFCFQLVCALIVYRGIYFLIGAFCFLANLDGMRCKA